MPDAKESEQNYAKERNAKLYGNIKRKIKLVQNNMNRIGCDIKV